MASLLRMYHMQPQTWLSLTANTTDGIVIGPLWERILPHNAYFIHL